MQDFLVSFVVKAQLEAGDVAGAKATVAMPAIDELSREHETGEIVRKLLEIVDIADAIATAKLIKDNPTPMVQSLQNLLSMGRSLRQYSSCQRPTARAWKSHLCCMNQLLEYLQKNIGKKNL
jgi:hypothetical protein